jgi:hypothetical protein
LNFPPPLFLPPPSTILLPSSLRLELPSSSLSPSSFPVPEKANALNEMGAERDRAGVGRETGQRSSEQAKESDVIRKDTPYRGVQEPSMGGGY